MEISRFKFQAKVTDTSSLGDQIVKTLASSDVTDEYIPIMAQQLNEKTEAINIAINSSKIESVMEEKDVAVDENIRSINHILNAFQLYPIKNVKDASLVVYKIFNKTGIALIKEAYGRQEALVNSLMSDFKEPSVQEAIAKLPGFSHLVENLEVAQADFVAARLEWNKVSKKDAKSATELKKEIFYIINNKIVSYLSVVSDVMPEKFTKLATDINNLIVSANSSI